MSSKYSHKEKLSRKLEQNIEEQLQNLAVSDKDDLSPEEMEGLSPDLFEFAEYNAQEAERTGYSNYSYWRSTFRMFFKNKTGVAMLAIMVILLLFTFIQPLLPDQYDPNAVNYYENALWMEIDEDASVELDAIKKTKGSLAEADGTEGILTYVKVPELLGRAEGLCAASRRFRAGGAPAHRGLCQQGLVLRGCPHGDAVHVR